MGSEGSAMVKLSEEVARTSGRSTDTTNVVLGSGDEEEWRRLDEKVNVYPCYRSFTAIGKGGDEFTTSMVMAVVSVMGALPPDVVKTRWSSSRSYTSVTVGPLLVQNVEEVMAIYSNMKSDERLKYFL
eukprot:jgi/Mesvir1/6401/Mv19496-RA.1